MSKHLDSRNAILATYTNEDIEDDIDTNAHLSTIDPMKPGPRTRKGLDAFEQGVIDAFNWLKRKAMGNRLVATCDAEDAAMRTICIAWQIRDRFTGDPSGKELRAWLSTVLKHVARDEYRRQDNVIARTAVRESSFADTENSSPADALDARILKRGHSQATFNPERALIVVDELAALAKMPDGGILFDAGIGLTMREIATKHGITVPAATARLHRARQLVERF